MELAKKIVLFLDKAKNITKWTSLLTETATFVSGKIKELFNLMSDDDELK